MGYHLGRDASGPFISKSFVTIIELPLIPDSKTPEKFLKSLRSSLPSRAMDQTMGYYQPCFSATFATVNPFDKSAFGGFGSTAKSAK